MVNIKLVYVRQNLLWRDKTLCFIAMVAARVMNIIEYGSGGRGISLGHSVHFFVIIIVTFIIKIWLVYVLAFRIYLYLFVKPKKKN